MHRKECILVFFWGWDECVFVDGRVFSLVMLGKSSYEMESIWQSSLPSISASSRRLDNCWKQYNPWGGSQVLVFDGYLFVADKCCVEAGFPLNEGLGILELDFDHAPLYALWITRKLIKQTKWPHGIPSTYLLTPWWGPPRPLWTNKHALWPHRILKIMVCSALQIIRGPIKCGNWCNRIPKTPPLTH